MSDVMMSDLLNSQIHHISLLVSLDVFKIQNSKFKIQNSKFKIMTATNNSKFKMQNSKFVTHTHNT